MLAFKIISEDEPVAGYVERVTGRPSFRIVSGIDERVAAERQSVAAARGAR